MRAAAANLEFERAAAIRDRLKRLRNPDLVAGTAEATRVSAAVGRGSSAPLLEVQEYLRLLGQVGARPGHAADLRARHHRAARRDRHRVADGRAADRHVHRHGARAAVGHDARSVRRAVGRRPARQRVDGQGTGPGADRADGDRPRRVGHRRRARIDGGDRPDRRAARRSAPIRSASSSMPRVVAGTMMVPVLTIISDARRHGRRRRSFRATQLQVAGSVYWNNVIAGPVSSTTSGWACIKPFVLGFVLVTIGCHVGLRTQGGTQGVGRATTNAVVGGVGRGAGRGLSRDEAADRADVLRS